MEIDTVTPNPIKAAAFLPYEFWGAPIVLALLVWLILKAGRYGRNVIFGAWYFLTHIVPGATAQRTSRDEPDDGKGNSEDFLVGVIEAHDDLGAELAGGWGRTTLSF